MTAPRHAKDIVADDWGDQERSAEQIAAMHKWYVEKVLPAYQPPGVTMEDQSKSTNQQLEMFAAPPPPQRTSGLEQIHPSKLNRKTRRRREKEAQAAKTRERMKARGDK